MAAELTLTIEEAALEQTTLSSIREGYRRALTGRICRVHGRGIRITEPGPAGELHLAGCCEAFVREARIALTN